MTSTEDSNKTVLRERTIRRPNSEQAKSTIPQDSSSLNNIPPGDNEKTVIRDKTIKVSNEDLTTQFDPTEITDASTMLNETELNELLPTKIDPSQIPVAATGQPHTVTEAETILTNFQQVNRSKITLDIGSKLKNRFILVEELGRGGMGVVYKARDFRKEETHDNEPFVAIKVLTREFQEKDILVIALQRETKKAQKLAHPNIITVFDFDRDDDNVFMTMEYLEGETLDTLLKNNQDQPVDRKMALSIIEQMCRALTYAHERGIVHSDLKPGNVFVTKSNVVKVLDFGIARAVMRPEQPADRDDVFDASDLQALTPVYASKEMLEGKTPDPRDDIYGMAVVACQLLTGQHPFNRSSAKRAHSAGLKPLFIDKLPRSLRMALTHALEFDREKRTPSATQFLQELKLRPRRRKSLKRRLLEASVFTVCAALGIYAYTEYLIEKKPELVLEDTVSIINPDVRTRVENLLEIAEVHTMVNRLMEPPGSSAFYAYQQVRKLHPENRTAHEGLRNIAGHYEQKARQSLAEGDQQRALQLAEKGLVAFPSHQGLDEIRRELVQPE